MNVSLITVLVLILSGLLTACGQQSSDSQQQLKNVQLSAEVNTVSTHDASLIKDDEGPSSSSSDNKSLTSDDKDAKMNTSVMAMGLPMPMMQKLSREKDQ